MKDKEKLIKSFITRISWEKVVDRWGIEFNTEKNLFLEDEFLLYWKQNPRQRPGQALINLGLIQDSLYVWNDTLKTLLENCHK